MFYIFKAKPFIMLALLLSFCSCGQENSEKFGRAHDPAREIRGIPVIGRDGYTSSDWGLTWAYPVGEGSKGHSHKSIEVKDGNIVAERDAYHSGIPDPASSGLQGFEHVHITYSYEDETLGKDPWSAIYYFHGGNKKLDWLNPNFPTEIFYD
jgi:hypothetical protein